MVDSGAQKSFLDASFAKDHHIPLLVLSQPITLNLADGSPSSAGPVTHEAMLKATIADEHYEHMVLKVTHLQNHPIILGINWLSCHNPSINWKMNIIRFEDTFCKYNCLSTCSSFLHIDNVISTFPEGKAPLVSIDSCAPCIPDPLVKDLYLMEVCFALFNVHTSLMELPPLLPPQTGPMLLLAMAVATITLPEMYSKFTPLFLDCLEGTLPPHCACDHAITLKPDAKPPFSPLYNLAQKELVALIEYINDNLAKGFICWSKSPAGAPVLFMPKKEGKLHLCVDYHALNKLTIKNQCPLPLITETLECLHMAQWFMKLDLKGTYNLLQVAKGDEWKMAFQTRYGHFEYLVMPFSLCNTPATFQAFLNEVLHESLNVFVIIYLDDILVFSDTLKEHYGHVCQVLQKLQSLELQVKLEKCQFHVQTVEFLGYVISPTGIAMDPVKVEAIPSWPRLTCIHDIQVFLRFANFYQHFIWAFS